MITATKNASFLDPGWYEITIISAEHKPGYNNEGKQLQFRFKVGDRELTQWVNVPRGDVGSVDSAYMVFGAALNGKEKFAVGETFDDDPAKMVGKTIMAEAIHYTKGKGPNKGEPAWKFNGFKPADKKTISDDEATAMKKAVVALVPGDTQEAKVERVSFAHKIIFEATGRQAKTNELTPDEAPRVWAKLNAVAQSKGLPAFEYKSEVQPDAF